MVNHAAPGALARADSERARQLTGVHEAGFYDG